MTDKTPHPAPSSSAIEELIDVLEGALVPDVLPYHSPEWVARARACVAKYRAPPSPASAPSGAVSEEKIMEAVEKHCTGTRGSEYLFEQSAIIEMIRALLSAPAAVQAAPIMANGLPVESVDLDVVCRFLTENSIFNGADIHRAWNELVAFYVAHRAAPAVGVPADRAAILEEAAQICLAQVGMNDHEQMLAKAFAAAIRALKGKPAAPAAKAGLHNALMNLPFNAFHAGSLKEEVRRAYVEGFKRARHAAAELAAAHEVELRAPAAPLTVPQWISVDEKLPKRGQMVLAYRPTAEAHHDPVIALTRYTGKMNESWEGVQHGFDCLNHPSHWMPLPAAPAAPASEGEGE